MLGPRIGGQSCRVSSGPDRSWGQGGGQGCSSRRALLLEGFQQQLELRSATWREQAAAAVHREAGAARPVSQSAWLHAALTQKCWFFGAIQL